MNKMFELVNQYPELNITVNAKDLKEMVEYTIQRTRQELEEQIVDATTESYLTREEVSKMLGVDKSTLWRWSKTDYLKPIEVGGKRKYRMSDVKRILGEDRYGNN